MSWLKQLLQETTGIFPWLRMISILAITFGIVRIYRFISNQILKKSDKVERRYLHNIVKVLLYIFGILTALSQVGIFKDSLDKILLSSGILALALGLAAQESLGNTINGIFISIFKPFDIGDRVTLINGKITGIVEDITLRHTIIKTYSNSRILIPNTTINKDMIENSNFQGDKVSSFIDVIITYDSNIELAKQIISDTVEKHRFFVDNRDSDELDKPAVEVFARELTLQGVALRASMWSRNTSENFLACSEVRLSLIKQYEDNGIRIASTIAPLPKI